jgi:hypothetical protein
LQRDISAFQREGEPAERYFRVAVDGQPVDARREDLVDRRAACDLARAIGAASGEDEDVMPLLRREARHHA